MGDGMSDGAWGMWDVNESPHPVPSHIRHPTSHIEQPCNHLPMASPAPLMLSVSGCRGIVGQTMTPEVAARFGMVVGGYLGERWRRGQGDQARPLVILGRDGRSGGEVLAAAA